MTHVFACRSMGAIALIAATLVSPWPLLTAQSPDQTSCDEFLPPAREVRNQKVGPRSCLMQETDVTLDDRRLRRLDIGLDGTVDGYVTKTGDYKEYLTNAPDIVFQQTADPGPIYFAVATYERDKGAAMTVVYPQDRNAWNGKVWVTVHGRGASFKEGNLKAWDRNLDRANPLADLNRYDRLMLSKGYALVKTRRTSAEGLGEIKAVLEDGSTVDYVAFNDSHRYIMDFTGVAEKALERRVGQAPRRTYFYGHSAGARIGRGINYTPGLNRGPDGNQMYNNIWPSQKADYMTASYLANKRNNARLLRDKGLTPRHRMYEVRSISHSGGESLPERSAAAFGAGRRGEVQILDLSKLMDRFIDMLDAWVEKSAEPPPTRSDWAELGDADRDGTIENPAIAFPEVACPLGVYFPYPNSTAGSTSFAAFSGGDLEPLDGNKVFVDMNRNGVWDFRETPEAAWRRLGLLQKGEPLTREKYVACIRDAAERLRKDGFFSERSAQLYAELAAKTENSLLGSGR
jgi:hypothetical protein